MSSECRTHHCRRTGQLQTDKTHVEEQCGLETSRVGHTHDLLDSAGETSRNLRENIQKVSAQYDQELADLLYGRDSLQAQLELFDGRMEASPKSSWVFGECLAVHQSSFVFLHLSVESDLHSGIGELLMEGCTICH